MSNAVASEISLERETRVFAMLETTGGVLEEPTSDNQVLVTGSVRIAQSKEQLEDDQRRNTRSRLSPIAGRLPAGEWSLPCYVKPGASVGALPEIHPFLVGLLGTHTQSLGSHVDYTLAEELDSLSLWADAGNTVLFCRGAVVNRGSFNIQADQIVSAEFGGGFMEMYWTTTSALPSYGGIDDSQVDIVVPDARLFSAGSIFYADDEIIKVGTVDVATNTLEDCERGYLSTTPAAHVAGTTLTPWLPTGTERGTPIHGKVGILSKGGTNTIVRSTSIAIENGVQFLDDERNDVFTSESYVVAAKRRISVRTSRYMRAPQISEFYDSRMLTENAFVVPAGVAGNRVTFTMDNTISQTPSIGGGDVKTLEIDHNVVATSADYEGELTIRFD